MNKHILTMGVQRNYSISCIRLISLLFIISCHIMQYLNMELAYWFNVGVQIFLCISGYLYGQKKVGKIRQFYCKRFRKILLPYYIVIVPVIILFFIFAKGKISWAIAGKVMVLNTTLPGGGHLWFIPTILVCYVVTPLLESFYDGCSTRNAYILVTVIAMEIAVLVCVGFADFYNPAHIGCYVLGYAIGVNEEKRWIKEKKLIAFFAVLSSMNLIQVYLEYYAGIQLSETKDFILKGWESYNHVFLGIFMFLVFKKLLDKYQFDSQFERLLDSADRYSYESYLIHQFLILGPFSLMGVTPIVGVNIGIILVGICFLALILKKCEGMFLRLDHGRQS